MNKEILFAPYLISYRVMGRYQCNPIDQQRINARIFRLILNDYLICREQNLTSALPSLERAVMQWLNRVGGMAGEW
jgi:hypothetical protein